MDDLTTLDLAWVDVPNDLHEHGYAMQAVLGDYILVVRTCTISEISQWRNRIWTVYWKKQELSGVLARGCCNSTALAQQLALAVARANA